MKIAICANMAGMGAADELARAFISQGYDTNLLYFRKDKYKREYDDVGKEFKGWQNADRVLVINVETLSKLESGKYQKYLYNIPNPAVWFTGSNYRKNSNEWNQRLDDLGWNTRFAMPDLVRLGEKNKMLWYTMEYDEQEKDEHLTICHSPGIKKKRRKTKGTDIINDVLYRLSKHHNIYYNLIQNKSHPDCLKLKAKSHIFIDQIIPEIGGSGKNGAEAIALGCINISSINNWSYKESKYYPQHPILNATNEEELYQVLETLLEDPVFFYKMREETRRWKKTLSYKNVVKYIMEEWK